MATNLSTINLQAGLLNFLPAHLHTAVHLAVALIEESALVEVGNWFNTLAKHEQEYALTLTDGEPHIHLALRLARKDDEIISGALAAFRQSHATCVKTLSYRHIDMLCHLVQFKYGLNKLEGSWDWMDMAGSALPAFIEGRKQLEPVEEAPEVPEDVVADYVAKFAVVRSSTGMYHRGRKDRPGTNCTWDGQVRAVYARPAGEVDPDHIRPNTVCKRCFKKGLEDLAKFAGRTGQLVKGGA